MRQDLASGRHSLSCSSTGRRQLRARKRHWGLGQGCPPLAITRDYETQTGPTLGAHGKGSGPATHSAIVANERYIAGAPGGACND